MKNKLGFLEFSNTKEKCEEDDIPFNVDYLIKELLDFGENQKEDFKTRKDKKTKSTKLNDENIVPNDIYVPDEYKKDSLTNIQPTVDHESPTKISRKDRRMVS